MISAGRAGLASAGRWMWWKRGAVGWCPQRLPPTAKVGKTDGRVENGHTPTPAVGRVAGTGLSDGMADTRCTQKWRGLT